MSNNNQIEFVAPSVEELNELIPNYEFVDFIAKGGMGAVYLARQTSLDRLVAIKILSPVLCEDADFKDSFETEAKLMAKLNHANMIGIYDFGEINGMLYIVMEHVKGESLFAAAGGNMIEQETAVNITVGICEGLQHAHDAGMLHRDVKPANIILNKRFVPKIGDFGLARPSEMTETGVIFGTPHYAAPEVLEAPDKVDHRTDIFAVGVMLYELLTGKLPSDPYVSVTEFANSDKRFDFIIKRAINENIDMRHESASELAQALKDVIANPKSQRKLLVGASSAMSVAPSSSKVGGSSLYNGPSSVSPESALIARRQAADPVKNASNASANFLASLTAVAVLGVAAFFFYKKQSAEDAIIAEQQAEQLRIKEAKKAALIKEKAKKERKARLAMKKSKEEAEAAKLAAEAEAAEKVVVLTPLQKLEGLKERLVGGHRPIAEMPESMFKLSEGARILMYIETPMTWHEADAWTQEYGGYIAVTSSETDMPALAEKLPTGVNSAWLGGDNTIGDWTWLDGSPWADSITLSSSDQPEYAVLSEYGKIKASLSSEKYPFFIEWRVDGSNPADLQSRLTRTGEVLGAKSDDAQYYVVKSLVSRQKAVKMAASAGGRLVAIAGDTESKALIAYLKNNAKSGEKYWTAATKVDQLWSWETGEPWGKLEWLDSGKGEGDFAVIGSVRKLVLEPVSAGEEKYGFIIEWGKDADGAVEAANTFKLSDLDKLKVKAREVIERDKKAREDSYASIVRNLAADLRSLKRRLEVNSKTQPETEGIDEVLTQVDGEKRVPSDLPENMASAKANDCIAYAKKAQKRLDSEDFPGVTKIREAFVRQLKIAHKQMEESGQVSMQAFLEAEIGKVSNDADFTSYVE